MDPQTIDQAALEDLKRQAIERAADLGHHLGPFRTAKHDPFCYVSFCSVCRQMVIVSLQKDDERTSSGLYGYALEAPCAAAGVDRRSSLLCASSR